MFVNFNPPHWQILLKRLSHINFCLKATNFIYYRILFSILQFFLSSGSCKYTDFHSRRGFCNKNKKMGNRQYYSTYQKKRAWKGLKNWNSSDPDTEIVMLVSAAFEVPLVIELEKLIKKSISVKLIVLFEVNSTQCLTLLCWSCLRVVFLVEVIRYQDGSLI